MKLTNVPETTIAIIWGVSTFHHDYNKVPQCHAAAKAFRRLLSDPHVLGIPTKNIFLVPVDKEQYVAFPQYLVDEVIYNDNCKGIQSCIFYYAGHGVQVPEDEGPLYLVTADTNPELVDRTALEFAYIRDLLQGRYQHTVFILDCCHSEAGGLSGTRNYYETSAKPDAGRLSFVIYSCRSEQKSYATDDQPHPHFSAVLFELLRKGLSSPGNPFISIGDISRHLGESFQDNTRQNPGLEYNADPDHYHFCSNTSFTLEKVKFLFDKDDRGAIVLLDNIVRYGEEKVLKRRSKVLAGLLKTSFEKQFNFTEFS